MYKIHDLLNSCLINDFLKVFVNLFFVLPWGFFTYAKKKMYDVSAPNLLPTK